MVDLHVILPTYNEVGAIQSVLNEWKKELDKLKIKYRFVVSEDGSDDGTAELLHIIERKYNLLLSQSKKRRGYGKAVLDGLHVSNSQYILCIDSDGQCDPLNFSIFWSNKNQSDVIIGWRTQRADSNQRKLFSSLFKLFFNFFFPNKIHDPSAPYVLFKRKTVMPYVSYLSKFNEGFWWGFIGMCTKKKLTVSEIKICHKPRLKGDTQIYKLNKIPEVAIRNIIEIIRLRFQK